MATMAGLCTLVSGEANSGLERTIQLRLTPACLTVQEEVVSQVGSTNQFDQSGLPLLREISLCRDHRGSFGFSVRGGSENRLPVLVSHVQKGMPAFKTKALFVGDAILRIDQASVEGATHDEVVERLKNAGQQVTLVVKHFREAAKLLHDQQTSASGTAAGGSRGSRRRASSSVVSGSGDDASSQRESSSAAATAVAVPRDSPHAAVPSVSSRDNLLAEFCDPGGSTASTSAAAAPIYPVSGAVVLDFDDEDVDSRDDDNPWVPRTAPTAAVKAPLASESFSTFNSSSSTGSTQLQQLLLSQPRQPQQQASNAVSNCRSSSSDSSKASLLPAASRTAAAADCTVFANRNASRNAVGRSQQRAAGNSSSLSDSWSQQQQQQLAPHKRSWVDVMTVPLKYGRITRYQPNSDQLRKHSFEVVGLNGHSTGCLTFASYEDFQKWFSEVHNNIRLLMEEEVRCFNEKIGVDFPPKTEPLVYMGWLGLTLHDSPQLSRLWQDVFLALRGDDLLLFEVPPIFLDDWRSASVKEKVYKCVIRVLDDEELLDKRLNAFFLHCGSAHTFYMSAEIVSDVSRLERCWFRATSNSLAKKSASGSPVVFKVTHNSEEGQLVFDLDKGVSFMVGQRSVWSYKFSCLKRSYDDRDRTLFLHFQDGGSAAAAVMEVQVPDLQLLLIVLHSFLSSKLTAVDPQFLKR